LGRCGDDNAPAAIPEEIWYDGPDGIASTGEIDVDLIVPVVVFHFQETGEHGTCCCQSDHSAAFCPATEQIRRNVWAAGKIAGNYGSARQLTSHHQHDAAVDHPGLEVVKHLVDVLQLRFLDLRAHIAFGGKCDCFGEVFAATYDRATDCNSIHDDVESASGTRCHLDRSP